MRELQNKLKTALNSAKTLQERFLRSLARYYTIKYKERLKRGFDTSKEEDMLFSYCVQYLMEDK